MGKSLFKKLFGRKSKPDALHLSNSGSLSSPSPNNNANILSKSNKRNILGRKKKKADKKAAFPSVPSKSVPLANREVEKENVSTNKYQDIGVKPTLSRIKEESPRNEDVPSFDEGRITPPPPPAREPILSPMSGNKPPLTPRKRQIQAQHPAHSTNLSVDTNNNLTVTTGYKELQSGPSLMDPLSPDASLKGGQILSPRDSQSSNDMCLSQDADDEEYNAIAFERQKGGQMSGNISNNVGGQMNSNIGGHQINNMGSQMNSNMGNQMGMSGPMNSMGGHQISNNMGGQMGHQINNNMSSQMNMSGPMNNMGSHQMNNNMGVQMGSHQMNNSTGSQFEKQNSIGSGGMHLNNNVRNTGGMEEFDRKAFATETDPFGLPQSREPDFQPMAHETQEDIRAWTPSPTKTPSFTFQGQLSPSAVRGKKNVFENFADFEPFDPSQQFSTSNKSASSRSVAMSSISPVSQLLEEQRARRAKGMDGSKDGSSVRGGSINSAPVNAHYVRGQAHRSRDTNISRVIDNLELHVNKRQTSNAGSVGMASKDFISEASSQHSRKSAESAIRDAKERIRRENLMSNESKLIDILAAGGTVPQAAMKTGETWLFDEVTGTLGPRSGNADLESLGGRSNRSGKSKSSMGNKSHRSHRSKTSRRHRHRHDGEASVDSRTSRNSRNSYRSYQTTKSMVSQMSQESRSVANDLLRLEAQLSMVGKRSASTGANPVVSELNKRRDDCGMTVTSRDFSISRSSAGGLPRPKGSGNVSAMARRAAAKSMRSKVSVIAPPGKLGIILANRTDSRGTVVSGVRTSSVLAEQVSPGDRIIAIDDEDVSQMNVKEITTIMARKSEFERVLTLLTAPKHQYD